MNFKSISSFASTVTSGHLIFVGIIFNKYLARLRARRGANGPEGLETLIGSELSMIKNCTYAHYFPGAASFFPERSWERAR